MKINIENLAPAVIPVGEEVLLSGTVYTARDAAHKKIFELLEKGEALPFEIKGACIYYAGPTAAAPGRICGSFGPTTSGRMDPYTPRLLDLGLAAMVGKGERSAEVIEAMKRAGAYYFCAIGGAGALAARCITSLEVIAFPELGPESVKKLTFENFPVICAVDSEGNNIFARDKAENL